MTKISVAEEFLVTEQEMKSFVEEFLNNCYSRGLSATDEPEKQYIVVSGLDEKVFGTTNTRISYEIIGTLSKYHNLNVLNDMLGMIKENYEYKQLEEEGE